MQKTLKKIFILLLSLMVLLTVTPITVFAETTTQTVSDTITPTGTTVTTTDENTKKVAGVTPDSWLYPIEEMIESVQIGVTFTQGGKAELLVSFANERLAEAQIMTEKNQNELVKKLITAYTKTIEQANLQVQKAVEDKADQTTTTQDTNNETTTAELDKTAWVNNVIQKIEIVENDADKVVIKLTGLLSEDQEDEVKAVLTAQVQNTIALKAYYAAKKGYVEAVHEYAEANKALGLAKSTGDEAAIKAAEAKVAEAKQYKEDMQDFRKDVLELRKEIKKENKEILKDIAKDYKESEYFKVKYSERKQNINNDTENKSKVSDKKEIKGQDNEDDDEDEDGGRYIDNKKVNNQNRNLAGNNANSKDGRDRD